MSKLEKLQNDFQNFLRLNQEGPMLAKVKDGHPMTAQRKLGVYYEAYRLRLFEVLQIDFPKLEVLLGYTEFFQLCMDYIDQYPSKHFSVRMFGQHFEQFLTQTHLHEQSPFLAEMVNFEWALMESLDAADNKIFTLSDLQQVPANDWPELTFGFHPSVHKRTYQWDTPGLWKDIEQNKPPRQPLKQSNSQTWIMWRDGLKSKYESMSAFQESIYPMIENRHNFSMIAQSLCEFYPEAEVPTLLVQHLQYWIEQGLITS